MNLFAIIPPDYRDRFLEVPAVPKPAATKKWPNFCEKLVLNTKSATIIKPLSIETNKYLAGYLDPENLNIDSTKDLIPVLKQVILESEKLWEGPARGVVLKCTDNIAVKIVRGEADIHNEYAAIEYLAKYLPDIPAPKPHGLIKLDNTFLLFMTYFPSTTLKSVWDTLDYENKIMIQRLLDDIFTKLRQLRRSEEYLDGTTGEVTEEERFLFRSNESITNITQPGDLRFSISQDASPSWKTLLRSFLPNGGEKYKYVFSHCDVAMKNIMVDINPYDGKYFVSGIVDWETAGFYPEYFEASKILGDMNCHTKTDWYAYVPDCIAPATYPVHWLLHTLWQTTVETS